MEECYFCANNGGEILFNCNLYRIVLVVNKDYPGYLQVILNQHVKELTDLSDEDNIGLYQAVIRCERILCQIIKPDKVNIASFGNQIPHVHWHIIPRFNNDKHFPNPIWGEVTHPNYKPDEKLFQLYTDFTANLNN